MNIYFIYLHNTGLSPVLYAVTNKKELKNRFLNERKKSLFISKKRVFDENEGNEILSTRRKFILREVTLKTNGKNGKKYASLILTYREEESIFLSLDKVFLRLADIIFPTFWCIKYFRKDLIKALHTLHYFEIVKMKLDNLNVVDSYIDPVESFHPENFTIDELEIFFRMYGNTLEM